MTYTLEQVTTFVDHTISDFHRHIDWAKGFENKTPEKQYEWAKDSIEKSYNQGFGALLLASVYLKEIDEECYKKLADRLSNEYFSAKDLAWNKLVAIER